jgi:hypothetical protein
MVSFDSAAKSGYPLKDWGNWQNEDWYDFLKDFDEPEHPELWKIDLQFGGQDLAKVLSETYPVREYFGDIVEEKYFGKGSWDHKRYYQQEMAHILWKNIPYLSIPAQTAANSWFSKTGRHKDLKFGSFVVLVQPKVDFVLVAIDLRECYATAGYDWSVFKPPYYVVTMVRKQMAKSWITDLLEIAHKNLTHNRSGLTWTEINELTTPKVSRLVEIRDFQTIPNMKLLNWKDSSIIMDYMELSPNPLRPFLWYLELQPAQYNSRYSQKGNWFIPYGRLTKKLFGDVFTDGYLAHQRYMLGGKKVYARTTPRKAWEYNQNVAPHKESSWEAEAKTSYSSDTYGIVMNKHLCPICEGPIPNAEHEGKYPGAMSRWDNVSEICSMCGSAEAMSPLLNPDARMLMQASREFDDFDLWREGVLLGRPAVEEMQRASMEAAKKLREMED